MSNEQQVPENFKPKVKIDYSNFKVEKMGELSKVTGMGQYGEIFSIVFKTDFIKDKGVSLEEMNNKAKEQNVPFLMIAAKEYEIGTYFHNDNGPTLTVSIDGKVVHEEFWTNGNRLLGEDELRAKHNSNFNDKINKFLDE